MADHRKDVKRGDVPAFVRESLPVRNFSNSYLILTLLLYIDLLVKHLTNSSFLSAI